MSWSRTSLVLLGSILAVPAAAQEATRLEVVQGTHERLPLDKELLRLALGDPEVAATVEIDTRQLLILGKKPGRTTLIVWLKDGSTVERTVVVRRDLSLLQEALAEIHSGIRVDVAPDRDAIVLRGVVPDDDIALTALAKAELYLGAQPLVDKPLTFSRTLVERQGEAPEVRTTTSALPVPTGRVIDLLRRTRPPELLEQRLTRALQAVGGEGVSVRRFQVSQVPHDEADLFVLEGRVRDQATYARVLRHANVLARKSIVVADGAKQEVIRLDALIKVDPEAPAPPTSGSAELLEERILAAVRPAAGKRVTVRRVVHGALPDDEHDVFVLEGRVRTQVELVRALTVADMAISSGRASPEQFIAQGGQLGTVINVGGQPEEPGATERQGGGRNGRGDQSTIRVLADESGALTSARGQQGQQGGVSAGGVGQGFGGGGGQQRLTNRVQQNVGRAKALSVAGGRILSFIEVDDLPQVRVVLRFYEVDRTKLEQADIDFSLTDSDAVLNPTNASRPNKSDVDATNVLSFLQGRLGDQFQLVGRKVSLTATFQLLESEGLARSLSSPTLTVLSGELATFTVGGEVPIPVAFSPALGGDRPAATGVFSGVEFREFGVQLAVRPLVGDDDAITLDLAPQVIQPDAGLTDLLRQTTGTSQQTTAFQTRSLRTSARLQDGQALLLGGLTTRTRQSDAAFTPLLHKVPVIEWLFQDTRDARNEVELIVLVNPVIVREPRADAGLWAYPDAKDLLGRLRGRVAPPSAEGAARAPAKDGSGD